VGKIACHGENTRDGIGGDFAHAVEFSGSVAWATAKVPLSLRRRRTWRRELQKGARAPDESGTGEEVAQHFGPKHELGGKRRHRRAGMKWAGAIIGLAFALITRFEAVELKVISIGGARAVMTSLVPEFERKSGHKVGIDFGTPGNMRDRLLQGEAADVAVAINPA